MMVYRTVLKWAGVWVMVMGVIVLVVRFTGALPANWWHYALLSLLPLIGAAWFVEYRRRPRMEQMRAAFDGENHAGGLVMAAAEVDTRAWEAKTQNLNLPSIQWRGGKAWAGLILALIFLIVAWLIPVRFASLISDPPLEVGQQVQQLQEQINVLEEENILPPDEAEAKRGKRRGRGCQATLETPCFTETTLLALQVLSTLTRGSSLERNAYNCIGKGCSSRKPSADNATFQASTSTPFCTASRSSAP